MLRFILLGVAVCFVAVVSGPGCDRSAGGVAEASPTPVAAADRQGELIKGIVVSCYRNGPGEWDGPDMEPLLDELVGLGATAIQIHPYARIANDGGVGYRRERAASPTLKPIGWANDRGMTTFLKPHLAYWGSGFSWRGVITFESEAQWQTFFREYTAFIVHQAELAQQAGADIFAVGTELHKTLHREEDWRRVIAEVRGVYDGKLTYAANWDEVDDVPFWDAVDLLGVQCYYPLSTNVPPSEADLNAGWEKILATLRAVSAKHDKPVLLAELGYAESEEAALRPWSDKRVGDRDAGAALKLRCMEVALRQIQAEPAIVGVFLWKWFPGDRNHRNEFVLQYDEMRRVIREAWAGQADAASRDGADGAAP